MNQAILRGSGRGCEVIDGEESRERGERRGRGSSDGDNDEVASVKAAIAGRQKKRNFEASTRRGSDRGIQCPRLIRILVSSTDLKFCSNEPTTTDDPLPFFFLSFFLSCALHSPPLDSDRHRHRSSSSLSPLPSPRRHHRRHRSLYVDTSLRLPLTALRLVTSAFAARQSHPNYMFPHVLPFDDERPFDDGHGRNRFIRWSNGRYLE